MSYVHFIVLDSTLTLESVLEDARQICPHFGFDVHSQWWCKRLQNTTESWHVKVRSVPSHIAIQRAQTGECEF